MLFVAMLARLTAQQDVMFTRYMFVSNMLYNPASVGRQEGIIASVAYRNQWAGVEGAPTTLALQVESSLQSAKAGIGFNVFRDKIGFDIHTSAQVNYSYKLGLTDKVYLAMGIKGAGSFITSDFTGLITPNPGPDPLYNGVNSVFVPNVGAGLFLYSERTYLGFSIPAIASFIPKGDFTFSDDAAFLSRHYYLSTGHVFDLPNKNFQLKPSIFIKYHPSAPVQLDLNGQLWYKDLFSVGFSYRTGDAVSGMIDFAIYPNFILSYAYDYTTSDFRTIGNGAHEIILLYCFKQKEIKVPSIHKFSSMQRF